jgi:RNase H-like domain found in reverse transcriptase/Reverse transcriptase (RNA-dependent DNA polymerase)
MKKKKKFNAQKMAEQQLQQQRILIDKLTRDIEELRIVQNQQPQGRPAVAIPQPRPLNLTGDKAENLRIFKHSWNSYIVATGVDKLPERDLIAHLECAIGVEASQYILNLPLTDVERATAKSILEALESHLLPEVNVIYERANFRSAKQESDEPADAFVNRLRSLIKSCQYGVLADEFLRDQIVLSMSDRHLQKRFYENNKLTLVDVIHQMKVNEAASQQLQQITNDTQAVNYIANNSNNRYSNATRDNRRAGDLPSNTDNNVRASSSSLCSYCGFQQHSGGNCPAVQATCDFCHKRGHYSSVCRQRLNQRSNDTNRGYSNRRNQRSSRNRTVNIIDQAPEIIATPASDMDFISKIEDSKQNAKILQTNLLFMIDGSPKSVSCQMDTGATCNVMGFNNFCNIAGDPTPELDSSSTTIICFGGSSIKPLGQTIIDCHHKNLMYKLLFQIVQHDHQPLLSATACERLQLIKICNTISSTQQHTAAAIIQKYADVFEGHGKLANPVMLEIDETMRPIIDNPRRIPIAVRPEFEKTIADLEHQGIIKKVTYHTDWVSNSLLVRRNNKLRLCIDPCHLNKALKRINYQMPTIDEILPELAKARVFTTLDAKKGFWQLELDKPSSNLTTFWGPSGRYRWLRVPFGISPAPELFQQRLHSIVHDLKGVEVIADDILIYGSGNDDGQALKDHNMNLEQLLKRLRDVNLKLNREKMVLCQKQVKFYGHLLTDQGVKADGLKIAAITQMPAPTDSLGVQRFLGMVTYLNKYMPHLSSVTAPLREFTKKNAEFKWATREKGSFQHLKQLLTTSPVLSYFDINEPTVIECDASSTGLGSVLLQNDKPIAYASRALTPAEHRYAQTLAIVFSCVRFNQYVSAKQIVVRSDHKPLEDIFTNAKHQCNNP